MTRILKAVSAADIATIAHSTSRRIKLIPTALYSLLAYGVLTLNFAMAQTKTIAFQNATWEEIKAMSAKENKLIFLDAYATWCGICKRMEKNVFTNDTVADYFNANFVNAKIDMESGQGIDIANQYNITVYPTFLFIDQLGSVTAHSVGALKPRQLIELGDRARDPARQNSGAVKIREGTPGDAAQSVSNKTEIGFNVSQYQKDFGIGLHVVSPYFFGKMVAIKAGTNIHWFESSNGAETTLTRYHNFQLGMRGRRIAVSQNISIYGEGGVVIILPGNHFSSLSSVIGGYGLFGFEFRALSSLAYFIELGGVGTGATAEKIPGKPIYSSGFLTNVGLRIAF